MATSTVSQTLSAITQAATGNHDYREATVSQTLPAVTQSSTAWHMFQLVESAAAAGAPIGVYSEELTDIILVVDTLYAIVEDDLAYTANASNTITYSSLAQVHESANASNSWTTEQTTTFSPTSFEVSLELTYSFSDLLTSTANASNTIEPIIETALQESAYASEALIPQNNANLTLTAAAVADGYADFYAALQELSATANASNVITEWVTPTETLSETANASDSQVQYVTAFEELLGGADVSNLITFDGSVYNNTQHETATANGVPWAKDLTAVAWVLNTETGGLSTYDNFQFTSIAEYNGVLYATSPEGVYALIGEKDDGRKINAEVKTGFLDFDRAQTKRISDIFVGYTGGQLEFDVETYDGPQEVYTYIMEERDADAPRNNRLKPGRGLSSRFWRFAFRNIDGADFQLYDVTAEVAASKRRL